MNTKPPTVVFCIFDSTLAILPIFSRLVTAGVTMSFFFNRMFSFIKVQGMKISSSLRHNLKGKIFPPRSTRTHF